MKNVRNLFTCLILTVMASHITVSQSAAQSLPSLMGDSYTVHKVRVYEGVQLVSEEKFCNTSVLSHLLTDYGGNNSQLPDTRLDIVTVNVFTSYTQAWGLFYPYDLNGITIDASFSHGYLGSDAMGNFIIVHPTLWDEAPGISSADDGPHNSFILEIVGKTGSTEIYFVNNSPQ